MNIHLFQSLGGWRFFDGEFREPILGAVYAEQDGVTKSLFKKDIRSLEINSKSGLSALWCAYGVYRARKKQELGLVFAREME